MSCSPEAGLTKMDFMDPLLDYVLLITSRLVDFMDPQLDNVLLGVIDHNDDKF